MDKSLDVYEEYSAIFSVLKLHSNLTISYIVTGSPAKYL